ncbi:MAG: tRNA preQ1(34) S-adenosylmethionine ribosyltransferase-isomerase QueA [Candidatus Polarisedimenticolia bacterium]
MLLDDFDYDLPPSLIAQEPLPRRDDARLMTLDGASGSWAHKRFTDLPGLLREGDLLVVNDTRVRAARLRGRRAAPGTGGRVEALLVEPVETTERGPGRQLWRAMVKGAGPAGDPLILGPRLHGVVAGREDAMVLLELSTADGVDLDEALREAGSMPLPPYIRREPADPRDAIDRQRYQTIFAAAEGAVAAPTASLHFTPEVVAAVRRQGVEIASLTLHVGPGTFQPVRVERIEQHRLMPERFLLSEALADAVGRTRGRGGRVVAVGTTVTRVLEHRADGAGGVEPGSGWCDLFIVPGHRFQVIDMLITNFHLPRSTLLMLVSAFAGREAVLAAYAEAVSARYRFYSYGDAMLLRPSRS